MHAVDLWWLIGCAIWTCPFPFRGLHLFRDEWCELAFGQIRHVEVPGLPVINDVVSVFGVCSHRASPVAFVVAAVDLLCREAQSRA